MKWIKRIIKKPENWIWIYLILILGFTIIYRVISSENFNFSNHNIINCFYFSVVTITTLGFGDVYPITDTGRVLVTIEVISGIISIGYFFNVLSIKLSKNIELEIINERERKELPLRKILYEEVWWLVEVFNLNWINAYRKVCTDDTTLTLQELFTKNEFEKITHNLDIFSYTDEVFKIENWGECLHGSINCSRKEGREILLKHLIRIEPDLYFLIDKFSNKDSFFRFMATGIESDLNNYASPRLLKLCGFPPLDNPFESIIGLINWCNEEYEKLQPKYVNLIQPPRLTNEFKIKI